MAGKYLTLEETAQELGVGVDEVRRLVDRKQLFPLKDGATVKFKVDDIARFKADNAGQDSVSSSGALELDLDAASPGQALSSPTGQATGTASDIDLGDLALDDSAAGADAPIGGPSADGDDADWVLGGDSGMLDRADAPQATGGPEPAGGNSPAPLATGSFLADDDGLVIDSLILSSPALDGGPQTGGPAGGVDSAAEEPGGTLEFPGGSPGGGSRGAGSGSNLGALSGSLALPLDSGVSLEDGELQVSGIDLAPGSGLGDLADGEPLGGPASLAGDAFELGGTGDDEDSASVVLPTESTGDSSFFENVGGEGASGSFADSSSVGLAAAGGDAFAADAYEAGAGMTFSAWQIVGLVSCFLFLLLGSFVMLDLVWAVRAPRSFLSAPLLDALANAFNWR